MTAASVTVVYTYNNRTCYNNVTAPLTVNSLPVVAHIAGGAAAVCVIAQTPAITDATTRGVWSITAGTRSASIVARGVATGKVAASVLIIYNYNKKK